MTVEIIGGKLYQWDIDRKLKVKTSDNINEVHFAFDCDAHASVVVPELSDGYQYINIPNMYLQKSGCLKAFFVQNDTTVAHEKLWIQSKPKPDDYIYTETEIKNLQILEDKIEQNYATKDFVEKEIAEFDFIKIVSSLPSEGGLPNRTYLVSKGGEELNDMYDEYIWVNNDWEFIGKKKCQVDLTEYAKKEQFVILTQEQYDALETKDSDVFYFIQED